MPKTDLALAGGDYAPVADRITLFYERFPEGRIITELVARDEREVTFRAAVYRSPSDREPAATGWAAEREGDGDVNSVACLENTETSAIGRALANLGFTASVQRPSAEEIAKAARARARLARRGSGGQGAARRVAEQGGASYGERLRAGPVAPAAPVPDDDPLRSDVELLLQSAERAGVEPGRLAAARVTLGSPSATRAELERLERGVRAWFARRGAGRARVESDATERSDTVTSAGADGRDGEPGERGGDVRGVALQG